MAWEFESPSGHLMKKRIRWSAKFAYVIGLITSDGSLSKDGRHIDFTSKDLEQVQTFARILKLNNVIRLKSSGSNSIKEYYHIQFGNIELYKFLLKIGLTPNKSKTIGELLIPDKYFIDFLRGSFDGDGCTYSYWDPRWRSSFMLYTTFVSASYSHLEWISIKVEELFGLPGIIRKGSRAFQLKYAKYASIKLLQKIYYKENLPFLTRKHSKIVNSLSIISKHNADVL